MKKTVDYRLEWLKFSRADSESAEGVLRQFGRQGWQLEGLLPVLTPFSRSRADLGIEAVAVFSRESVDVAPEPRDPVQALMEHFGLDRAAN